MIPDDAPRADAENPAVAAEEHPSRRPPPWLGRTLWALAVVAILGPFIVFR